MCVSLLSSFAALRQQHVGSRPIPGGHPAEKNNGLPEQMAWSFPHGASAVSRCPLTGRCRHLARFVDHIFTTCFLFPGEDIIDMACIPHDRYPWRAVASNQAMLISPGRLDGPTL